MAYEPPPPKMDNNEAISHMSQFWNYKNGMYFQLAMQRRLDAMDSQKIPAIKAYFNSVEVLWWEHPIVKDYPDWVEKFFAYRARFLNLYDDIINRKAPLNERTARDLMNAANAMYFLLVTLLQDNFQMLFRVIHKKHKGLDYISNFMDDNIFSNTAEQTDEEGI